MLGADVSAGKCCSTRAFAVFLMSARSAWHTTSTGMKRMHILRALPASPCYRSLSDGTEQRAQPRQGVQGATSTQGMLLACNTPLQEQATSWLEAFGEVKRTCSYTASPSARPQPGQSQSQQVPRLLRQSPRTSTASTADLYSMICQRLHPCILSSPACYLPGHNPLLLT